MNTARLFRFMYRYTSESNECGPWNYLTAAINDSRGARRLVSEWNRRDRDRIAWKYDAVLPDDIEAVEYRKRTGHDPGE